MIGIIEIEKNEVRVMLLVELLERLGAVRRADDVVAFGAEDLGDDLADVIVVVDDEYAPSAAMAHSGSKLARPDAPRQAL